MNIKSKQLWIGLALAVVVAVGAYTWFSGKSGVSEKLSGSLGAGLGNSGAAEISGTANTGNLNIGQNEMRVPGTQCSGIYDQDRCEDDSECDWERVNTRRQSRPGEQIPHECVAAPLTEEPAPRQVQCPNTPNHPSPTEINTCNNTAGCLWSGLGSSNNSVCLNWDSNEPNCSLINTQPICLQRSECWWYPGGDISMGDFGQCRNAPSNNCSSVPQNECGVSTSIRGRACRWSGTRCQFGRDQWAPVVTITSPTENTVTGSVTIAANVIDDDTGIKHVLFKINGREIARDSTRPYSTTWNATSAGAGSYRITVSAENNVGMSGWAEKNVTVPPATATPVNNLAGTLPGSSTDQTAGTGSSTPGTHPDPVPPVPPSTNPDPVPPVQPGQLPAAIVTTAAASTANSDATATPGQTDIDLGSFTLTANADAKFTTMEFTKTGSTPNSALSRLALKKADGSTLGFEQRVTSAGKVRFNFAETNLGTTPQTFRLTATLNEAAPPETNFTFSLQAQPGSLAGQAQDVTLAGVPFALRRISIPAAAGTPDETQKTLSVLAGRPARSTDTNVTAGEAKDLAVLELTFTNGQPLEPIAVDGLTLRFTGTLPVTKLSEPVFYFGATGRPMPASQATVTRDIRNGDITAEFTDFEVDLQTSLILYVKVSTNSGDGGKTIQYEIANVETDQSVDVEIQNAGSPTFTVASASTAAADDGQQTTTRMAAEEEARKSEEVRKAAEEAKAAAEEAKKVLEEAKKEVAKKKSTSTNSGAKTPVDRQLADAMGATTTSPPTAPAATASATTPTALGTSAPPQRSAADSKGLEGSQRITRAPERGNTGPGVGMYVIILGAIQVGRLIRKKLGKK